MHKQFYYKSQDNSAFKYRKYNIFLNYIIIANHAYLSQPTLMKKTLNEVEVLQIKDAYPKQNLHSIFTWFGLIDSE